jgi:hypothetical protein
VRERIGALPTSQRDANEASAEPVAPGSGDRDRGDASRLLPSHTTVRTGPYTAVRRIERTPVPAGGGPPRFGYVHLRGSFGPSIAAPAGFTLQFWR